MNRTEIFEAISNSIKTTKAPIDLHEPFFNDLDVQYVTECIKSGWVSSVGNFVPKFEEDLCRFTGAKHAIAVVNGTAALHLGLKLAGVKTEDEVLVPALTFVATANAILYCQAIPHFVDSAPITLGVCPKKLRAYLSETAEINDGSARNKKTGRKIKALIVMHAYGHPVDLDPIGEICAQYKIALIQDAAEALGSCYNGRHVGHHGLLSTLSFNGNKIITTGGGGAILTNDHTVANRAKHLSTTAKRPHAYEFYHDEMGFNYRLPNLNAALGCAQMKKLEGFLAAKRKLHDRYREAFRNLNGVRLFTEQPFAKSNHWLNVFLLNENTEIKERNEFLDFMQSKGMKLRPAWQLLNRLPAFQGCPQMNLESAQSLEKRLICLPSSAVLNGENEF